MHIQEASIPYEPYIYSNAGGHIILQPFFHFDGNQHIVFKRNELVTSFDHSKLYSCSHIFHTL